MEPKNEQYFTDIIKKSIKLLNELKGANFKLADINFGLGVDSKYGSGQLDTIITITVQEVASKKTVKLFYYESFFNADLPYERDAEAGVNKLSKPEDKVLVRVAYSIWCCRHRMTLPQKKNKK